MASEESIEYWLLSEAAKQRMDREDPDEQRVWFADITIVNAYET